MGMEAEDMTMELCSMNDAARALGLSYYEVYNLSSSGKIGRVKKGRRVFVPMDDVRQMASQQGSPVAISRWLAIGAITDDRKDARPVMMLVEGYPVICTWEDGWRDPVGHLVTTATMFADIEVPS